MEDEFPVRMSTKLATRMKRSSNQTGTKGHGGAKVNLGKRIKKVCKKTDSSQPGIRQFLMEIKGNSHGKSAIPINTRGQKL